MATAKRKARARAKRGESPMAGLGDVIAASVAADRESWTDALPQPLHFGGPYDEEYVRGYNRALEKIREAITAKVRR